MSETTPPREVTNPSITFFPEYGVHEVPGAYIISEPTWEAAVADIKNSRFGASVVVLPELITIAGHDLPHVNSQQDEAQRNIEELYELSRGQAAVTFIVGSPDYSNGREKPYNGVFIIKNGAVHAISHKRMPSLGEAQYLAMDMSHSVTIDEGRSGILICKDIVAASFADQTLRDRENLLEFYGGVDREIARQMASIKFIDDSVQKLLIIACWGVGINPLAISRAIQTQEGINRYYRESLKLMVDKVFNINPNLRQVIVSDRAPISSNPIRDKVASEPMSLYASR